MNPKTLAMHKSLQPKIRKAMGPLQNNDRLYCPHCKKVHTLFSGSLHDVGMDCLTAVGNMVVTPLTVDDSSEEARKRSLWGMVDWSEDAIPAVMLCSCPDGKVNLIIDAGEEFRESHIHADLTDALLLALCKQCGVEVEG